MGSGWRALGALGAVLLVGLVPAGVAGAQPPPPSPGAGGEQVLDRRLPPQPKAPGVVHQEFVTTAAAGRVEGDLLLVDLANPQVDVDLLYPGTVTGRAPLTRLADQRGAVGRVNGDFFDIRDTFAPAGPAVAGGVALKSAVPADRRLAPAVPGTAPDAVLGVVDGEDGPAAVLSQLRLAGRVETPRGEVALAALNTYAIPPSGVGVFTPAWGAASRAGAVCCSAATVEVEVRGGLVSAVRGPGAAPIPADGVVLAGRDGAAAALRGLRPGDPVRVDYRLVRPQGGPAFAFAVGAVPVLRDGVPLAGLDDAERAPRTGAGLSPDGRLLHLVTVDGRQEDSVGATLSEFAALLRQLGVDDAANLDGGGSSTLVLRDPGAPGVTVRNDPSDDAPRSIPNGIGVFARSRRGW